MLSANFTQAVSGVGQNVSGNIARTADGGDARAIDVPHGWPGTLTTRANATTGEITLVEDHEITTGMTVDIYWSGGVRYGVPVGTVSGTAAPFAFGHGDVLPSTTTPVVVSESIEFNAPIDGDSVLLLGVGMDPQQGSGGGHISFETADGFVLWSTLLESGVPRTIDVAGGAVNVLNGPHVAKCRTSTRHTTLPGKLRLTWLADATPTEDVRVQSAFTVAADAVINMQDLPDGFDATGMEVTRVVMRAPETNANDIALEVGYNAGGSESGYPWLQTRDGLAEGLLVMAPGMTLAVDVRGAPAIDGDRYGLANVDLTSPDVLHVLLEFAPAP